MIVQKATSGNIHTLSEKFKLHSDHICRDRGQLWKYYTYPVVIPEEQQPGETIRYTSRSPRDGATHSAHAPRHTTWHQRDTPRYLQEKMADGYLQKKSALLNNSEHLSTGGVLV